MEFVNAALRGLVSALLYPFRGLHPLVGLTAVSLVTGIAVLLVFKATSDQEGLTAVKRKIHACLFEIRLFNDDLRAILRAQGELLRHNLAYLRLTLVPMLWMIVPFLLVFGQLHFHYGYSPLPPESDALVEVVLAEGWEEALPAAAVEDFDGFLRPAAALAAPDGVRIETPGVWAPDAREMTWRIAGELPGDHELAVELGGERYTKSLRVAGEPGIRLLSPVRPDRRFVEQILYPTEPPLPEGPVASISVSYPPSELLGVASPWTWAVLWLVLAGLFAFALRNRFGVSI